ncbi:hypothetical protein INR49_026175, partial [Caranx melampygus]
MSLRTTEATVEQDSDMEGGRRSRPYSLDVMKEYHCAPQPQEFKPHIFIVAEEAYRNVKGQLEPVNQSWWSVVRVVLERSQLLVGHLCKHIVGEDQGACQPAHERNFHIFYQRTAELLCVPAEELRTCLRVRTLRAGKQSVLKPCSQAECNMRRDCLAKVIYA